MVKVSLMQKINSFGLSKKLGIAYEFGQRIYGEDKFGLEEIVIDYWGFGFNEYGDSKYGEDNTRWGVYQKRSENGKSFYIRMPFMTPANPKTATQQNWRQVFTDGVIAWQNLTSEQQQVYNKRASKLNLAGYNLFLKEYLNSHK